MVTSAILLTLIVLGWFSAAHAAPVTVRILEGAARGFLVVRTMDGQPIAHGELVQRSHGSRIDSRLTLTFVDGSLWDEQVSFSQDRVFRLEAYRLLQRGPSLPISEIEFDRRGRRFMARTEERKGDGVKEASGQLEMPADLYNGMALILLKNLPPGQGGSGQMVVFTPTPRLIQMDLVREGEEDVRLGPLARKVIRYLVRLEVRGLTGVIAALVGKDPPDSRYWLAAGEVPTFVRFIGAMFLNGPTWRLELTTVEWPEERGRAR
jgi:hypothetical protein